MTRPKTDETAHRIDQIERNLWEMWSEFGRSRGSRLHEAAEHLWFETLLPILPYNGVVRFQHQEGVDRRIRALVEHFDARGVPFLWILHPSSPPGLHRRLLDHGLRDVEPILGMARDLAELPKIPQAPAGIEIRKVESEEDVTAFSQFAAWRWHVPEKHEAAYTALVESFCFGKPGSKMHMWQAWRGDQPIAKAGLYECTSSVGIYGVATRPEARRLGLARILSLSALHWARDQGRHQLAVLHSSPMAESLYASIGFDKLAELRLLATGDLHI